ncbi:MAG: MBL fold metallo-hydrolase [Deltaproteobacteria bacterium]|nr:MBL fold metallo-hydrolase [Deltaproteobacteria bacterium]
MPIEIRYLRASMALISLDGFTVLTDPWFRRRMRGLPVYVRPALSAEQLPPLDLILVSHLHPDHFDAAALARLAHPCPCLVGPPALDERRRGPKVERVVRLDDGGVFEGDGFTVRAVRVQHSGYENAYMLRRNGRTLFFGGDARYDETFRRIGTEEKIDVALLPVGGTEIIGRRIVMDPEDAYQAALDLNARVVVPIHEGGEWMSVPPLSRHPGRAAHLAQLARDRGAPFRVRVIPPGQTARLDNAASDAKEPA